MRYPAFLIGSGSTAIAVLLLGWLPASSWGGQPAIHGLAVGCLISFTASAIGGLPIARTKDTSPGAQLNAVLFGMVLRSFAALLLGVTAALKTDLDPTPLLVGLAISYLALLLVEVFFVYALMHRPTISET